ncbi:NnrU family protein [Falsiroseomonas oryziterrae]|uniref:NnrU family protein n=1 Tax=Falsiroseomonas oryziterrae TaxID=2911368 RepID=UPI001F3EC8C3|nr:NnrU family protein [Roseomonas sp. NPKOSM-4]
MTLLILAAALWVFIHIGVSGTRLRDTVVARLGEGRFVLVFSLASVASIALLVIAWQNAETTFLWSAPSWLRWILALLMLPAFVLFMASHKRNPTAVGNKGLGEEPRGIQRVTRHPMLMSFALWGLVHVVGNGDTASLVFFGAFLVTAVAGMPSIDAKLARRNPEAWRGFAEKTSILPFGAILSGRNRLVLSEIGWMPPVVGLILWMALLHFHRGIFGVPAVFV